MITPDSAWTLPMCSSAAAAVATEHGLTVRAYIEGSARRSVVRVQLLRAGAVALVVQVNTDELEACRDERAVRALIQARVLGVIAAARAFGYVPDVKDAT